MFIEQWKNIKRNKTENSFWELVGYDYEKFLEECRNFSDKEMDRRKTIAIFKIYPK